MSQIPVLKDLPVGKYLQEHVGSLVGPLIMDEPVKRESILRSVNDFYRNGNGLLSTSGIQATAFFVSNLSRHERDQPDWPDNQFVLIDSGLSSLVTSQIAEKLNLEDGISQRFWGRAENTQYSMITNIVLRSFSRGEVKLQSKDPFVPLKFDPRYLEDERDVRVLIEGAKRAVKLFEESETYGKYNARLLNVSFPGCEKETFKSDGYWECSHRHLTLATHHQSGTCPMGKRDSPVAVVDSELRVFGTKNLRVVDASVMPNVTAGSLNAPVIMIAEVVSDAIKSSWS